MTKIVVAIALCFILPSSTSFAQDREVDKKIASAQQMADSCEATLHGRSDVIVSSTTVCLYGEIDNDLAKRFVTINLKQVRNIVLSSTGGDVDSALKMANLILQNKINVIVWKACLSSCANYLFLAGYTKIVLPKSFVGWHGGPSRSPVSGLDEQANKRRVDTLNRQDKFFHDINVSDDLIYVARPGLEMNRRNRGYTFWTWNADDLQRKFGVRNIIFMGKALQ